MIDNPDYKGEWVHPMIPNKAYAPETYAQFKGLTTLGFELWVVNSGSIFDNILVTDDVEYAKKFAAETFEKISSGEKEAKDAFKDANKEESSDDDDDSGDEGDEHDEL